MLLLNYRVKNLSRKGECNMRSLANISDEEVTLGNLYTLKRNSTKRGYPTKVIRLLGDLLGVEGYNMSAYERRVIDYLMSNKDATLRDVSNDVSTNFWVTVDIKTINTIEDVQGLQRDKHIVQGYSKKVIERALEVYQIDNSEIIRLRNNICLQLTTYKDMTLDEAVNKCAKSILHNEEVVYTDEELKGLVRSTKTSKGYHAKVIKRALTSKGVVPYYLSRYDNIIGTILKGDEKITLYEALEQVIPRYKEEIFLEGLTELEQLQEIEYNEDTYYGYSNTAISVASILGGKTITPTLIKSRLLSNEEKGIRLSLYEVTKDLKEKVEERDTSKYTVLEDFKGLERNPRYVMGYPYALIRHAYNLSDRVTSIGTINARLRGKENVTLYEAVTGRKW